jgi:hypothetical protein
LSFNPSASEFIKSFELDWFCIVSVTSCVAAVFSSEIAEFEELDADLVEGFEVADGAVRVPTGAGSA